MRWLDRLLGRKPSAAQKLFTDFERERLKNQIRADHSPVALFGPEASGLAIDEAKVGPLLDAPGQDIRCKVDGEKWPCGVRRALEGKDWIYYRIDRASAPEMGDEEADEMEQVLNAAMNSDSGGVLYVRDEDGILRPRPRG